MAYIYRLRRSLNLVDHDGEREISSEPIIAEHATRIHLIAADRRQLLPHHPLLESYRMAVWLDSNRMKPPKRVTKPSCY